MSKTVDELASQAGQMLAELGYGSGTIRHYKTDTRAETSHSRLTALIAIGGTDPAP